MVADGGLHQRQWQWYALEKAFSSSWFEHLCIISNWCSWGLAALFFICHFSVRVWNYLQIQWPGVGDLSDIIQAARNQLCVTFSTEIILLACWNIWKVCNGKIFETTTPTFRVSLIRRTLKGILEDSNPPRNFPAWIIWFIELQTIGIFSLGFICTRSHRKISIYSSLLERIQCSPVQNRISFESCSIQDEMPLCIFPISAFWEFFESKRPRVGRDILYMIG